MKIFLFLGVTFYASAFGHPQSCALELESAWNQSAGVITLSYHQGAIFRLDGESSQWQKQQTKFPLPVRQLRPLQLSQRAFQPSAFVAAVEIKDPRVVWLGSLLFPETQSVCFPGDVLDTAWLATGPKSYRLFALSNDGVYSVEVVNRSGKPSPSPKVEMFIGFENEGKGWDRLFAATQERVWLARETGEWGRAESKQIQETKLVDWIYSLRAHTENGLTTFCGLVSKDGKKSELCYAWDQASGWQSAQMPAALQAPHAVPGLADVAEPLSPQLQLLLNNTNP